MATVADTLELGAADRRAFAETERLVGGTIVKAESQGRWRPAWVLELDRDGERETVELLLQDVGG